MYCPIEIPIKCISGHCKKYSYECNIEVHSLSRRMLLESTEVDPGCSTETPNKCYDGSCRKYASNCPTLTGCTNPIFPYRCDSGTCVADKSECGLLETCPNG